MVPPVVEATSPPESAPGADNEPTAREFAELYGELWRMASRLMRRERRGHTLQATALVHEAFWRISARRPDLVRRPAEFARYAARTMRSILVDHARRRALREETILDQGDSETALGRVFAQFGQLSYDVLALDEALQQLEYLDRDMARAVELRFFAGFEFELIASTLEMTRSTFERHWRTTMLWLGRHLS